VQLTRSSFPRIFLFIIVLQSSELRPKKNALWARREPKDVVVLNMN
jgi:hypothetical protein